MAELTPEISRPISPAKIPERITPQKEKTVSQDIHREILAPSVMPAKHSLEAAKVKKLQKKPVPPLWKTRAEFLPATAAFLHNCGVDSQYVNPIPIGQGFTHIVFSYLPEGEHPKVIKIPRVISNSFMSTGYRDDKQNIDLVKKYFGAYAVPTEVRLDNKTGKYLYVQNAVNGKPVTHLTETQSVRSQLTDLARLNREMMRQTGHSLDFIGVPGFFSLMRHQIRHLFSKKSAFEVSNIFIDDTGKLKIIDDGLLRFKDVPFQQGMTSNIGFLLNRVIMRLYFGVDLKPKI